MKKKISIIIICSLLLCGCNIQERSDVKSISMENAKTVVPSVVFDSVDITPLELNENTYFKGVRNLSYDGKRFVVCDNRNILYTFSSKGEFIASSERKLGNGHGEYSVMTAYSYNSFSESIEIATPTGILFYDSNFNLKKYINLSEIFDCKDEPKLVRSISDISDHEHLLLSDPESDTKHVAYVFDSNTNSIKKQITIEDETCVPITMQSFLLFNRQGREAMFYPPLSSNYVYAFDMDKYSFTRKFFCDFGKDGLSTGEIKNCHTNKEKFSDLLLASNKLIPIKCMATGNKILMLVKRGSKANEWMTFCVDTKDYSVCAIPHTNKESLRMFPIYGTVHDNAVFTVVPACEAKELVENFNETNGSDKECIDDGAMVILKYRFR